MSNTQIFTLHALWKINRFELKKNLNPAIFYPQNDQKPPDISFSWACGNNNVQRCRDTRKTAGGKLKFESHDALPVSEIDLKLGSSGPRIDGHAPLVKIRKMTHIAYFLEKSAPLQ